MFPKEENTMPASYNEIQELLRSRADLQARLNLMPYDGTPEIKERTDGKYLYIRKRVAGKLTSTYVGAYTEELYNLLLRNAREIREIRKSLRSIEKQLAAAGYKEVPEFKRLLVRYYEGEDIAIISTFMKENAFFT